MKKDFCMFYQCDVQTVFFACQRAIKELFKKDADASPYHTLAFGIPPSFRYNMNGGACNVHFLSHNGGTAVNVRYSIVQLGMARCGAHNKHITERVQSILGINASEISIPVEVFMNNKHNVNQAINAQPQSVAPRHTAQCELPNFCSKCGTKFAEGACFCSNCGNKR